jgi:hypothetical protein
MKFPSIIFFSKFFTALLAIFLMSSFARANAVVTDLNYLGTSGLFFVPTGKTINYGEFQFYTNNFADVQYYRDQVDLSDNKFSGNSLGFALSLFPGLEVGVSNMGYSYNYGGSDLIANIKYSPTFIPNDWFDMAIGAIDLGGETGIQRALYSSFSKQFGDLRFTAGSGVQKQDKTLRRYEGGFAGIEYQPYPWFTALAEHDGVNDHYGVKVRTPKHWLGGHTQFFGSALLKSNIEDDNSTYFSLGVRTSLYSSTYVALDSATPIESSISNSLPWLFSDSPREYKTIVKRLPNQIDSNDEWLVDQLSRLKRALTKQGFESVWVGTKDQRLVLRFENSVFNRNDIDALGVAMGLAAEYTSQELSILDLTLSKYGVPTLRFETSLEGLKAFFAGEGSFPAMTAKKAKNHNMHKMLWVGGSASPFYVPRIEFSPKVRSYIGTVLGVMDYSVALSSNVKIPLWTGAFLSGDYEKFLGQTSDFDEGRAFNGWSISSGWSGFSIKQTIKLPLQVYSSFGLGRFKGVFQEDHSGLFGEMFWQSKQGKHMLILNGGYYESNAIDSDNRRLAIGKYRYYWDDLDIAISVEGGQYWRQDKGGKLEAAFNFGDTQVQIYMQNTSHQVIGIGFSVPIGIRKDTISNGIQLKGADRFDYGFSTTVNNGLGYNPIFPGRAKHAPHANDLLNVYFNNDRLNISYIRANKHRLIESFQEWVKN